MFERTLRVPKQDAYDTTTNLYIADLNQPPPQRLVRGIAGTTRPDWCWIPYRPNIDGQIACSNADGIYSIAPSAGSTPQHLRNSSTWIYPTWFPGCGALAVDATQALPYGPNPHNIGTNTNPGPATLEINPVTSFFEKALSGRMQWAGFPSVNRLQPRLIVFAGQQFSLAGYDQDENYIYVADNATTPSRVRPLDQVLWRQPWQSAFNPA